MNNISLMNYLDQLPANVYIKDLEGRLLDCNERDANSFGFTSKQEAIGTDDFVCFAKEDAEAIRKMDQTVMQTRKTLVSEESATVNGEVKKYLSSKAPLKDAQGVVQGIIGVSIEIT